MAAGSSHTPATSLIMPPCSPDFLVSSTEAAVQPTRRPNRARLLPVTVVDDAATPMAARSAAMTARTKATSQRGCSDQSGQLRTAIDCRSRREAARVGTFVIRPAPRHLLRTPLGHSPPFPLRLSAQPENSATHP